MKQCVFVCVEIGKASRVQSAVVAIYIIKNIPNQQYVFQNRSAEENSATYMHSCT